MSQTVDMNIGQQTQMSLTVTDQNGNAVPTGDYTITATVADSTIVQESINGFGQVNIKALKLGSTTVNYTISANANSGYQGSLSAGPDTFNVNPIQLASASYSYSVPK